MEAENYLCLCAFADESSAAVCAGVVDIAGD
jgi:hypothetical protein